MEKNLYTLIRQNNSIRISEEDLRYYETDDINGLKLYTYQFKEFPNKMFITLSNKELTMDAKANFYKPQFDIATFIEDIQNKYLDKVKIQIACKNAINEEGIKIEHDTYKVIFYWPSEKMVLCITPDFASENIILYYHSHETINDLLEIIKNKKYVLKEKIKAPCKTISLITKDATGFKLVEGEIKQMEVDLDKHYNDGFKEVDKKIVNFLEEENTSGLIILKGEKGTGKTTYIRRLVNTIERRFIYLTKELAHALTDPTFISFLAGIRGSVLVIEDCENLVRSRDNGNNDTGISNLLNLCDGLLSDVFNIKVLVTFNTDLENIDTALLRKGRLVCMHNFDKLSVEKTNNLFNELGVDYQTLKPMAICDIFNFLVENGSENENKKQLGFN